jgi:Glycosyltransferase 61
MSFGKGISRGEVQDSSYPRLDADPLQRKHRTALHVAQRQATHKRMMWGNSTKQRRPLHRGNDRGEASVAVTTTVAAADSSSLVYPTHNILSSPPHSPTSAAALRNTITLRNKSHIVQVASVHQSKYCRWLSRHRFENVIVSHEVPWWMKRLALFLFGMALVWLPYQSVIWKRSYKLLQGATKSLSNTWPFRPPPTAWCILHPNNTNPYFSHFPHAVESLSRCWSFAVRMRERHDSNSIRCGLYLHADIHWDWVGLWGHDLMKYAGCRVHVTTNVVAPYDNVIHAQRDFMYEPYLNMSDSFNTPWFDTPHDAQLLKQTVLRHYKPSSKFSQQRPLLQRLRQGLASQPIQNIGLVVRPAKPDRPDRVLLNQDEIIAALSALNHVQVNVADMNNLSMLEQAVYFSEQDVVVSVHGAALSNVLFLQTTIDSSASTSSTASHASAAMSTTKAGALASSSSTTTSAAAALVEIFPTDWEFAMFHDLMQSCGNARHYRMVVPNDTYSTTPRYDNDARKVDLRPNISQLVQLVQAALDNVNATVMVTSTGTTASMTAAGGT